MIVLGVLTALSVLALVSFLAFYVVGIRVLLEAGRWCAGDALWEHRTRDLRDREPNERPRLGCGSDPKSGG